MALVLGIAVWVVAIRFVVPRVSNEFSTLGPVVHAVMAIGVLGTLLNDAGIFVWLAATIVLISPLAYFSCHGWRVATTTSQVNKSVALPRG